MSTPREVVLLLFYHAYNAYSLNVLGGAVDTAQEAGEFLPGRVEVFPVTGGMDALKASLRAQAGAGRTVLTAWSFYSPEAARSFDQVREVKSAVDGPGIVHLAGGVHASAEPRATLEAGFDLAAIGEGERTLVDCLKALLRGEPPEELPGIASLSGGRYRSNGPGPRVDLDPWPPYFARYRRFNPFEITRGCIYACKFCQTPFLFKARFRHRSVAKVAAHAKRMRDMGLKSIRFTTPTSFSYGSTDDSVDLAAIESLLSAVREAMGKDGRIYFGTFPSEVRPEHVSAEALRIVRRYANNDNIILGGQSGSQRILDATNRGHGVEDIERAAALCLENGFLPNVDFIFGLPGEGEEDMEASLNLAERLARAGARIHGHTFMPLPGTPLRKAAAGRVAERALERLHKLEAQGKLYGQWRRQQGIAGVLGGSA
jgi:B12-binding domain/radical SAM domain protein